MREHIFTIANAITVFRIVLFAAYLWLVSQQEPRWAVGFFIAAWALDGVDGWVARVWGEPTYVGSVLDKATDRVIIVGGVLWGIAFGYLPREAILLLTKDIALIPLLTIHTVGQESVRGSGAYGKAMTFLQGIGIVWLFVGLPYGTVGIGIVAGLGALVGGLHLHRVANSRAHHKDI